MTNSSKYFHYSKINQSIGKLYITKNSIKKKIKFNVEKPNSIITIMSTINNDGKMAEIVEVDKSGRIVIPKKLRDEIGIHAKTKLILTKRDGNLTLTPLDVNEIAQRLEAELKDIDVEGIAQEIRREINDKIRKQHPELSD